MKNQTASKVHVTENVRDADETRVTLPVKDNGTRIDWERVRESRRSAIKELLAREAPAAAPASVSAADAVFTSAWVSTMLDALGQLEVTAVMRVYGCTHDQAIVMLYSHEEKKLLTDPIVRVLNKYATVLFSQYGDEFALGGLLVTITLGKLTVLQSKMASTPAIPSIEVSQAQHDDSSQAGIM